MLTAEGLAVIMYDLFGGVVYAGIDTDKHKYPIGKVHLYKWFVVFLVVNLKAPVN